MRRATGVRPLAALWAAAMLAAFLPACGMERKSAETGLASLEAAYAPVRQQAASVAPELAGRLEAAIAAARADFGRGDYKASARAAGELRARVKELSDRLPAMQTELESAWTELGDSLPKALVSLERRLARANRPRDAVSRAAFDAARAELPALTAGWRAAQEAMRGGRLAEAVNGAEHVRDRARRLSAAAQDGS